MSRVFIFPTYNESETIHKVINELLPHLDKTDLVIIADDSERIDQEKIVNFVKTVKQVEILLGTPKSGRGKAVWNSLNKINKFPDAHKFSFVIEADGDGSHSVKDILRLAAYDESKEFVIGSRYLPTSRIVGWSLSRRVLSRILNLIIPKLLGVEISDITNGLRRYSMRATQVLVESEPKVHGFMYLSEQALVLTKAGFFPTEIPIQFENRIAGKTSVTFRDLIASLVGLMMVKRIRW